jgi:imidazolonepropionase-like amidohydrolase
MTAASAFFAGTDDIPGFGLHRELELYVQAGIPAAKVLQMATWNAAMYTGNRLNTVSWPLVKRPI